MNKYLHIKWKRIIAWGILSFGVTYGLYMFDILYWQSHSIIFLDNYSDVVLVIWQVQAAIASLTIAATAFIIGRIDESYYGISVKNLLHLSRRLPRVGLSFWEKMICSILVLTITWAFAILDNVVAVTFMFFVTIYLTSSIVVECINIITKSDIYSSFAEKLVEQMVGCIVTNPYKYHIWIKHDISKNEWIPDEKQKNARVQFRMVMEEIGTEISCKIKSGIYLWDDDTFQYYVGVMNRFSREDEAELFDYMYTILCDWLRVAIEAKTEKNIRTLLEISYSDNKNFHWATAGIAIFMNSYYHGEVYATCFQSELDNMCKSIRQSFDDYTNKALAVLHISTDNADVSTFSQIIKSVWLSNPYDFSDYKGNVLITALAYLYYMTFKEHYILIDKGQQFIKKLKEFPEAIIMEKTGNNNEIRIKDIFGDVDTILRGSKFLIEFLGNARTQWEYIPLGEAKTMHLGDDIIEFLTFYCYLFYQASGETALELLPLNSLLKMKSYISNIGIIEANHLMQYSAYCNWLGKSDKSDCNNINFYNILIMLIKKKLLEEAIEIRSKKEIWTKKLSDLKEDIIKLLTDSSLYKGNATPENDYIVIRYSDFYSLKSFSEHMILYGDDHRIQSVVGNLLFHRMHYVLDGCNIVSPFENAEEAFESLKKMFAQMAAEGLTIDQSFNQDFFELTKHAQFSPEFTKQIEKLKGNIKNIGNWDCGYNNIAFYIDSKRMNTGFYILEDNFMSIAEDLTPKEISFVRQRYKTSTGYIFKESSNSVEIPFSEDELNEFLKVIMFKIRYVLPATLPRQKVGFFSAVQI